MPPVAGFALRVSRARRFRPAGPAARLAVAGARVAIRHETADLSWAGTLVVTGHPTADESLSWSDGALVIAGELYHCDELRAALGGSAILDDRRLVAAAWERYGVTAFRILDGRFAAVLTHGSRLVVATDYAGSVPLYVRRSAAGVDIATELKAFAGSDGEPADRVSAGTVLCWDLSTADPPAVTSVWRPSPARRLMSEHEATTAVRQALTRAVGTRLAGDPAPTVVLSGGIDSSMVAALVAESVGSVRTVSVHTDLGSEATAARQVAQHLGADHQEVFLTGEELVREIPWAVWATETADPDILEYVVPLVALYRRLDGSRRILTGYGADIPLGGMHRNLIGLDALDRAITHDLATFDGLNEMSPVLSGIAGHWTTHPYWDRSMLDLLVSLEPGLKRRAGLDKWVLRAAAADLLPSAVVRRRKLGIHEGTGMTSAWGAALARYGVAEERSRVAKRAVAEILRQRLLHDGAHPDQLPVDTVHAGLRQRPAVVVGA